LVGPSGTGVSGGDGSQVYAMRVYDDGGGAALFVGGVFKFAGQEAA
jgi:hypothetical protein